MLLSKFLKYNEAGDGDGSSGAPAKPNEEKPATPPATPPPEAKKAGDIDDYGYEKVPKNDESGKEGTGAPKEGEKPPAKTEKEEIPKDPVSGYGEEPPKQDPADKVEDPPADPPKPDLEFEVDVKDLDQKEVEKLTKIIKDQKLSKEQAQAIVDLKKGEVAAQKAADVAYNKEVEKQIAKTKSDWHNELKSDPDFGGDKFAHSIARVEKFIGEFMVDTKKVLTERKSMLPPYVMKDILRAANRFYGTEKLVTGDESTGSGGKAPDADKKEVDPLAFYT